MADLKEVLHIHTSNMVYYCRSRAGCQSWHVIKNPKPSYLVSVYLLNEAAAFQWHTLLLIRLKAGSVISLFYNISHHFSPALPHLVAAGVLAESWVYYLYQLLLLCLVPALCDLGAFSLIFHSLTAEYLHSLRQTWRPQDGNFICSTNCALLTISDLPSSVFVWQRDGKREERCYLSIVWPRCVYKDGCLYVDTHTHEALLKSTFNSAGDFQHF